MLLSHIFVLSHPVEFRPDDIYLSTGERLATFVSREPQLFQPGSVVIRCAQHAGGRLQGAGIQSYDHNAYERVMSKAPPEVAHLSHDVANRINQGSMELFAIGETLSWLASILPATSQGNLTPYQTTGSTNILMIRSQFAQLQQVLPLYCQTDPAGCRLMIDTFRQAMPQMDDVTRAMVYSYIMMTNG